MLYQEGEQYTTSLKIQSDDFVLVDLSLLRSQTLSNVLLQRAADFKCSPERLAQMIEDTLLSTPCLSQKISAVILPPSGLTRQFHGMGIVREDPLTPFEFLDQEYKRYLLVGVKVGLGVESSIGQLLEKTRQLRLQLVSFDLREQQLQAQVEQVARIAVQLMKRSKKMMFHLNLKLSRIDGLKVLKRSLVLNRLPLERICLQTDLLNLISQSTSSITTHWEDIAFTYLRTLEKYIPSAVGSVLQSYRCDQQLNQAQIEGIYRCLSCINKRGENLEKENKKYHTTGICLLEPVLFRLVKQTKEDQPGRWKLRSTFDAIELVALRKAVEGKQSASSVEFQLGQI